MFAVCFFCGISAYLHLKPFTENYRSLDTLSILESSLNAEVIDERLSTASTAVSVSLQKKARNNNFRRRLEHTISSSSPSPLSTPPSSASSSTYRIKQNFSIQFRVKFRK